jgi:predicted  nucleic acid-binding Zn-ribbon protein
LNEEIKLLTDLQVIDLQIAALDEEINAGSKAISKLQNNLEERRDSINELTARIDEAESARRSLEASQTDELSRIKERQSKMMQVQTNREYHSLLKEIEDGKKANKDREEETIRLMEQVESYSKIMAEQKAQIGEDEKELAEEIKQFEKKSAELNEKKAVLAKERDSMVKNFSANLLKKYDMLRERRNGRAVVGVINGVCQGCFMNIPPQQFNDLLRGDKMLFCPICQRILYHQLEQQET